GAAVVPFKGGESALIAAVTGTNEHPRMPPADEGPALSNEEISLLRRWIDQGAKAPVETPVPDPRKHWAFQPVQRPEVPVLKNRWGHNPIDAFVAAEQEKRGLVPAAEAPKHVLLRRVYLDLIGLRPTRDELQAFLADESPNAYETVVDRLLKRPEYGERWGRHWMDVWRYSDWAGWGQQVRDSQPHIWHWRDWIIEQLNADRPYDEMVVAMLSADETTPADQSELRATGFLARNFKLLSREQWLQDTVEHTAKSLLGLTINCCRCHDHMTDPVDQVEYYAFRAIFEPHHVRLDRLPGIVNVSLDGLPRVFDKDAAAPTFLFVRGDERNPRKDKPLAPNVPAVFGGTYQLQTVALPREASDPLRRSFVVEDDLAAARRAATEARKKFDNLPADKATPQERLLAELAEVQLAALQAVTTIERIEAAGDSSSPAWKLAAEETVQTQRRVAWLEAEREVLVATNDLAVQDAELAKLKEAAGGSPDQAKIKTQTTKCEQAAKKKADGEAKLKKAQEAAAKPIDTAYAKRTLETFPATSTGRRTALARWIVDPQHPLTARVAVNHLWGRHFDRALVATTANFGTLGAAPTHPQLLDWLAAELVAPQSSDTAARPWSMKHLHRLIVTSSTYRQAANSVSPFSDLDPDNKFLWHFPSRRLEAEVVRDCVLASAGQLDATMGGPDIDHQQGLTIKRRSLYFRNAAEKQMTFLKLFDMAGVNECYERRGSVMPQQALALANSELTLVQSRLLARRLNAGSLADDSAFAVAAFETVISRPPRDSEIAACAAFLTEQRQSFEKSRDRLTSIAEKAEDGSLPSGDPTLRARENLIHVLFNHHEFVTLP
ncbi:MAG: DUF1553 domain-containing protein, partial [Planctomycetaceae bacterium]|nr:DUF1553 domain-containing protein [Planctomycetaceae bacterium]